jgi:Zn-dependent protease with chaperone function
MNINSLFFLPCYLITVVLLFSFTNTAYSSSDGEIPRKVRNEIEKKFEGSKISIQPQVSILNAGFSYCSGKEIYFLKSHDPIFHQEEAVIVMVGDVEFDEEIISFELKYERKKVGKVTFILTSFQAENLTVDKFDCFISDALETNNIRKVFLDSESNKYHVYNNNHYRKNLVDKQAAIDSGAIKDPIGFPSDINLHNFKYEKELAQELVSKIILSGHLHPSDKQQMHLSKVGKDVLDKWPLRKLGYEYKFYLLDSNDVNAYAIPGGKIYVTKGLYDAVDNDFELQVVLAHEIAHVEKRHTLSANKLAIEKIESAQALQGFAAALAVYSASRSNGNSNRNLAIFTIAALVALYTDGWPLEQERAADFLAVLYFKENGYESSHIKSVFKKLQFKNLISSRNPNPASKSHPKLEDRIASVQYDKYHMLSENDPKIFSPKMNSSYFAPLYSIDYNEKHTYLSIYFSNYKELKKIPRSKKSKDRLKDHFQAQVGGKLFGLTNIKELETRDLFGIYKVFRVARKNEIDFDMLSEIRVSGVDFFDEPVSIKIKRY